MSGSDGPIEQADPRARKREYQREWHRKDRARKAKEHLERRAEEAAARLGRPPESLGEWFPTQTEFRTWAQLAARVGITPEHICRLRDGKCTPTDRVRSRLLAITGLTCFGAAADLPTWARSLIDKASDYLDSLPLRAPTRHWYMATFKKIVMRLAEEGVSSVAEITPARLLQTPPRYRSRDSQRRALGIFVRFLVHTGNWHEGRENEFLAIAGGLYKRQAHTAGGLHRPSTAAVQLIKNLIFDVGLRTTEVRKLRISQFRERGLELQDTESRYGPGYRHASRRTIPYGDAFHAISRSAFDAWIREAAPRDFLFYSRGSYSKPAGRPWIISAAKQAGFVKAGRRPLHLAHLEVDFRQFGHPASLRLHFEHFHGLKQTRAAALTKHLLDVNNDRLPAPYLVAVAAAVRLLECDPRPTQGGRVSTFTLDAEGYSVAVWAPVTFFKNLTDSRRRPSVARQLLKLALNYRKQRCSLHSYGHFPDLDRPLAGSLELIRVKVTETNGTRAWEGPVLSRRRFVSMDKIRHKARYFSLPLLEDLWGGETNGRCEICRRMDRLKIDEQIRHQTGPVKIARNFGIPYGTHSRLARRLSKALLWHSGKLHFKEKQLPGHVGHSSPAPLVVIPPDFWKSVSRENATNLGRAILSLVAPSTGN